MKRTSKEAFVHANNETLVNKCRVCIKIVEQQTRKATAKEHDHADVGADPDNPLLPEDSAEMSPETLGPVFSLFSSVPEVIDLDSIYKRQLFRELRVLRFAKGSTVRFATHPSHTSNTKMPFEQQSIVPPASQPRLALPRRFLTHFNRYTSPIKLKS